MLGVIFSTLVHLEPCSWISFFIKFYINFSDVSKDEVWFVALPMMDGDNLSTLQDRRNNNNNINILVGRINGL